MFGGPTQGLSSIGPAAGQAVQQGQQAATQAAAQAAAAAQGEGTPGTISWAMPAARTASSSSSRRPNSPPSPDLSRTTRPPARA